MPHRREYTSPSSQVTGSDFRLVMGVGIHGVGSCAKQLLHNGGAMNERYIQAVIIGVLAGGAILLAEMIDAGNVQGPAIAESMSPSLVPNKSAN